ncbi:DUF4347 domain-containing protein, partial [Alphaproteobacteria bacterium]|nr:DUF4347 domain-containing protein [Alphaproteobacteria bacterium]
MNKNPVKTPLIYALEPRLLFDGDLGADVASAIVYRDGNATDTAPAVAPENQRETQRENISFEFHSTRGAIVFIDGGVEDPQTLADAAADVLPDNAQIHILDSDSDGFAQINEILQNHDRVEEIHIFGHGTAGEARLGTASLSLETLTTHSGTLAVLKDTLTEDGDILLYGCNIATGEIGQTFIEELAELTAADIAASDDITGVSGDWHLEASTGPIEANTIQARDYQYSLTPDGVASLNSNIIEKTDTNLNVRAKNDMSNYDRNNRGFWDTTNNDRFVIALEKGNITATETLYFDFNVAATNGFAVSTSNPVNSYLIALNNDIGRRDTNSQAEVVFDNDILGYYVDRENTLASGSMVQYDNSAENNFAGQADGDSRVTQINNNYFSNPNWTYPNLSASSSQIVKRDAEGYYNVAYPNGSEGGADYVWTTNNKTLRFAAKNDYSNGTGDFIRVITRAAVANNLPTAADNTVTIAEDATKTFAASEFNFADVDGNSLNHVKVTSLPAAGTLKLNNTNVTQGQSI